MTPGHRSDAVWISRCDAMLRFAIDGCYAPEKRGRSVAKRLCPRNVGAELSDNNYAQEFFGEWFFLQIIYLPRIGQFFKKIYVPEI